jgi:hypothetical protein
MVEFWLNLALLGLAGLLTIIVSLSIWRLYGSKIVFRFGKKALFDGIQKAVDDPKSEERQVLVDMTGLLLQAFIKHLPTLIYEKKGQIVLPEELKTLARAIQQYILQILQLEINKFSKGISKLGTNKDGNVGILPGLPEIKGPMGDALQFGLALLDHPVFGPLIAEKMGLKVPGTQ